MTTTAHQETRTDSSAGESHLLGDTVAALWTAWWRVRLLRQRTNVGSLLPPVAPIATPLLPVVNAILRRVERIVRVAAFWKFDKACFYRSFAAASVLRQRGVPAQLNFGLRIKGHRRERCHCWRTVDGRPVAESGDPLRDFPVPLGQWQHDVRYWLAADSPTPHPLTERTST